MIPRVLSLTLLVTMSGAEPKTEQKREAQLVEIEGNVWVRPPGDDWEAVQADMLPLPLQESEGIKTGAKSQAVIQIDEVNTFELGAKTEFELSTTNLTWTKFRLFTGSFISKIEEKLKGTNRVMQVLLPTSVLSVRGTEFSADTEPEDGTNGAVGVFEGEVEAELTDLEGSPKVTVGPEQEMDLVRSGPPPAPRALKKFLAVKKRMNMIRQRHAKLRTKWRRMPLERRKAIKNRIRKMRRRQRGQ